MKTYKLQFIYDFRKAVRESGITATQKLLLLIMSDYADPDGSNVRPAQQTLADQCSSTRRTVNRNLSQLVNLGWLSLVSKGSGNGQWGGSRRCNKYQLKIVAEAEQEVPVVVEVEPKVPARSAQQVNLGALNGFGVGASVDEIVDF